MEEVIEEDELLGALIGVVEVIVLVTVLLLVVMIGVEFLVMRIFVLRAVTVVGRLVVVPTT